MGAAGCCSSCGHHILSCTGFVPCQYWSVLSPPLTPSADVAQVQRAEIARLLVELAMQSALMRDTLQDEYDLRREQRRELHELRMKFKR